ncbi:MAG TPA: hypothetical protein VGI97_11180 [Gemmatimonadaceae bacterium]|jgi:hypothetical protein
MQTSRLRPALLAALLPPAALLLLSLPLRAQAVTGVADDATTPRGGEIRFSIASIWKSWYERYGQGTPGRPNGSVEPLGVDFNFDTIGVAQLENLGPIQSGVRSLSGIPGFTASLGTSNVLVRNDVLSMPLTLEMGLTNHISLSAMVPFVTATSRVNFTMNPAGFEPTVGFNPTLFIPSVIATNNAFLAQFDSAGAQLSRAIATCTATPGAPGCGPINSNPSGAKALVTNATSFASGVAQLYGGRSGAAGSLFVPISGTAADAAIVAKVAAFRSMYAVYGNGAITGTGPIAAQAPLTATDMQTVLTDPAFGINAQPLATSVTRGIGDIELGLKLNLYDSFHGNDSARYSPSGFNFRQSFGGIYRLGTGTLPSPGNYTQLGTGDHQTDVEGRTFTDLLFGRHFWLSLVGSYTVQMADQLSLRIPDSPTQVILASYRQETVQRKLGNILEIQVNPHWQLNEYLSFTGQYYYARKAADTYTGQFTVTDLAGNTATLDAAVLGMYTEATESRVGIGATYSTVASVDKHKAGLPFDISYFHYETTLGTLGRVPKISVDQVTMRVYQRLFGH